MLLAITMAAKAAIAPVVEAAVVGVAAAVAYAVAQCWEFAREHAPTVSVAPHRNKRARMPTAVRVVVAVVTAVTGIMDTVITVVVVV